MQPQVVLYKDPAYSGTSVSLKPGRYDDLARATGMPKNSVSSVKVPAFMVLTLYSGAVYGGSNIRIVGPAEIPDLRKYATGFNDKTVSAIVEAIPPTKSQMLSCCTGGLLGDKSVTSCEQYTPESATCKASVAEYCANNMSSPFCQTWCRNNTALCDAPVIAYCAKNPKDPYCACVNSRANKIANPKCVDSNCIKYGYLTTNMERSACPNLIDCSIKTKLINSGVSLATIIPIEQNCGNTGSGVPAQGSVSSTTSGISGASGTNLDMKVILGLFVFTILLMIIIAFAIVSGASPVSGAGYMPDVSSV